MKMEIHLNFRFNIRFEIDRRTSIRACTYIISTFNHNN